LAANDCTQIGHGPLAGRHYVLVCSLCGRRQEDDGLILSCPEDHVPSLLRTEYVRDKFEPRLSQKGISRYQDWLPVTRAPDDVGRTVVYRSAGMAKALGIGGLWIAFNGYWPERGADLETATFKDFEAYTVLRRLPERQVILTVASSGNTGAAFAWACSSQKQPCLLIIPSRGLNRLRFRADLDPCVHLVVIDDGDYPDAIDLAAAMCRVPGFQPEGGIQNVGRRDGLATVLLAAFEEMHCLPSHYFQAVGSGTGAIAVLEAAKRLRGTAHDLALPKLMLCQNLPFTPIYDAWRTRRRSADTESSERFRDAITHVYADELTNWKPPYAVGGGVYDSLAESGGEVLAADNESVGVARNMFQELEGIDIEPAAAVAVACLKEAVARQQVGKESAVLLNITGGGRARFGSDHRLIPARPQLRLTRESLAAEDAVHTIAASCILPSPVG
jgi:cysteate synthase